MKMQTILHEDVTGHSFDEPRAMLEVIGARLLELLSKRYPEKNGYLIEHVIGAGTDPPFSARWDISLSRGKQWRFKIVLEVFRTTDKAFFHTSIGRNMDRNGVCLMLGMLLSLFGLIGVFTYTDEALNGNAIAPILFGTVIGGFILSFPIRPIMRSYIIAKARDEGIEASETRLIEEVKEVLRHAGQLV